ncbi:hypothetical protein KAF25_007274 [Fusarium avenaceum]|uniref:Uncharacterized protein n=1 Tax=Fusarium avenaceum TaxID=40199 RepID=A0A9P7KML2_9HYPO|nr:hypothetical protein KAF25_007274 [Fusarium avenaceum]
MSRHHPDLVMCRKQAGIAIGRLCDKCDGKCPVCDSYVRPTTLVRICDECSFGNYQNKCVVCGGEGISDAFYCFECTRLEKDRDGCPKIINLGSSRTDVIILPEKNESYNAILAKPRPGLGREVVFRGLHSIFEFGITGVLGVTWNVKSVVFGSSDSYLVITILTSLFLIRLQQNLLVSTTSRLNVKNRTKQKKAYPKTPRNA